MFIGYHSCMKYTGIIRGKSRMNSPVQEQEIDLEGQVIVSRLTGNAMYAWIGDSIQGGPFTEYM